MQVDFETSIQGHAALPQEDLVAVEFITWIHYRDIDGRSGSEPALPLEVSCGGDHPY
jgi:hypothetical protein